MPRSQIDNTIAEACELLGLPEPQSGDLLQPHVDALYIRAAELVTALQEIAQGEHPGPEHAAYYHVVEIAERALGLSDESPS